MIEIRIKQLKPNPNNVRTIYDTHKMASLTLQILERGLDPNRAIIAKQKGDDWITIAGHRRTMAFIFSLSFMECKGSDDDINLETVTTHLETLTSQAGDVLHAAEAIKERHGESIIPIMPFEGEDRDANLLLLADNFGAEEPDPLGIAIGVKGAIDSGLSAQDVASAMGKDTKFVLNHYALGKINPEIAKLIVEKHWSLPTAAAILDIESGNTGPQKRLQFEAVILKEASRLKNKSKIVMEAARTLKAFNGFALPLTFEKQTKKNNARAMVTLFEAAREQQPEIIWSAVTLLILKGAHEAPWDYPDRAKAFYKTFGSGTYYDVSKDKILAGNLIGLIASTVNCSSCPVSRLGDLISADFKLPCRKPNADELTGCMAGFADNDLLYLAVPRAWYGLDGVKGNSSGPYIDTLDSLLSAHEAMRVKEAEEEQKEKEREVKTAQKKEAAGSTQAQISSPSEGMTQAVKPKEKKPSRVEEDRKRLAHFMATFTNYNFTHPLATGCTTCTHRREDSPVKSAPDAPHCNWAKGEKDRHYQLWTPGGAEAGKNSIPICYQYEPETKDLERLLPEHDAAPEFDAQYRIWIKGMILKMVEDKNQSKNGMGPSGRYILPQFTGVPIQYTGWRDWLKEAIIKAWGNLNDKQIWYLYVVVGAYWTEELGKITLPQAAGGLNLVEYHKAEYPKPPKETPA